MPQQVSVAKRNRPRFKYIGEIANELKKVVWLSRREVIYLTGLVLIVSIIFGVILGAVDFGFSNLIDKIFLGQ